MVVRNVLPQILLAGGAVVVLLFALVLPRRRQSWCAPVSLLALLGAGLSAALLASETGSTLSFSGTWALDGVTAWTTYAVVGSGALVVLLSPRWFHTDPRHGEWYVMLLFSALGATLLAGATDLSLLMVAMLLTSATGYTMASFHRNSRMSAEAGAKLYFLGALANPMLFLGIAILYGVSSTTGYPGLQEALLMAGVDPLAVSAGVALVLVGLAYELGAFPVFPWVPDVAQGAPAPAAAFLTVAPKLGALVATARFVSLLPDTVVAWRPAVALAAALTMTVGNLAALWQNDARRMLGWSSVSQAGYGLLAVVAIHRSDLALSSLLLFVMGYAAANVAAFSVVTSLRGRTKLEQYEGLGRTRPMHAAALTIALLSLTGVPPLVGFAVKLALFGAAIEAGYAWLAVVAVVNTIASLFYYLRLIAPMYTATSTTRAALLGWQAVTAVCVSIALVVTGGLAAQKVFDSSASATLLPQVETDTIRPIETSGSSPVTKR